MRVAFDVPGLPESQGSAKAFVVGGRARIQSTNKKLKSWRRDAMAAAKDARDLMIGGGTLIGPVRVSVVFSFPRPKSHYRSGRFSHLLSESAPRYKSSSPDCDKLARATLDSLMGAGVIRDDGQVVELEAKKVYGEPFTSVIVVGLAGAMLTESEAA